LDLAFREKQANVNIPLHADHNVMKGFCEQIGLVLNGSFG